MKQEITTWTQRPNDRLARLATFPAELKPILEAALRGDPYAQRQMQAAFARLPEFATEIGDVAHLARTTVMRLLDAENPTMREALSHHADGLTTHLGREGDTELERLVIDRAVIAWLWVHFGDIQLADRLRNHPANGPLCRDATQRLGLLQNMFTNALKNLALLRKLTTPLDLLHAGSPETSMPRQLPSHTTNRLSLTVSAN